MKLLTQRVVREYQRVQTSGGYLAYLCDGVHILFGFAFPQKQVLIHRKDPGSPIQSSRLEVKKLKEHWSLFTLISWKMECFDITAVTVRQKKFADP